MKNKRLFYFDGIRGLAAISVILTHIALLFFGNIVYKNSIATPFDKFWVGSPLNAITQGNLAVVYFFILSGFLITRKVYTSNSSMNKLYVYSLWKKLLKIVIPGIVIVYLLMKFNFVQMNAFYSKTGVYEVGSKYFNFNPTLLSVMEEVVYKVILFGKGTYNGPLWTLFAEFWGSVIVYYAASLLKAYNIKNKKLIYALIYLILLPLDYNVSTVVLGALVFDTIYYLDKDKSMFGQIVSFIFSEKWTLIIFYIVGIYLATINEFGIGIWSPISSLVRGFPILRAIGMAILFLGLYRSESI